MDGRRLKLRTDKPAVVMVHHNPQFVAPELAQPWSGISDTAAPLNCSKRGLISCAFIFGHTHTWKVSGHKQMKMINLPPVAYVFGEGHPNGWVSALLLSQTGLSYSFTRSTPSIPERTK